MIRTLLATTALAAVMAFPVAAQDVSSEPMDMMSSEPMDMMSSEPMGTTPAPADTTTTTPAPTTTTTPAPSSFDIVTGYTQIESDRFATRLIGQPVYDGTAADANMLGTINDLVLDEGGNVAAATVGVGGFLGIGEKQVAVSYSALQWVVAADNTQRFVLNTTVEELTAAPEFIVVETAPNAMGTDPMAPATDPMMTPAPVQQ